MFYWLYEHFSAGGHGHVSVLNLLRYLTFRTGMSVFTAQVIVVAMGYTRQAVALVAVQRRTRCRRRLAARRADHEHQREHEGEERRGRVPPERPILEGELAQRKQHAVHSDASASAASVRNGPSSSVEKARRSRVVAIASTAITMPCTKTDVAPALFEPPAGYSKVAPEKVRQQIDALTGAVTAILKAMMANVSNPSPSVSNPSPSPAASLKP